MSNTWNGTTFTNIAQRSLATLKKKLIPLVGVFTTDFSDEVKAQGTTVSTRIVPASGAAGDLQSTHTGNRAAAAEDTSTTAVTVTLNQQPIVGFHLTDEEAAQIGKGVWSGVLLQLITQKMNALALSVHNTVINLITAASYSQSASIGAAAGFDTDDIADLRGIVANWPEGLRKLVLGSTYMTNLMKDPALKDKSASGSNVLNLGAIRDDISGFTLYEGVWIPPVGGTPASENLVGFMALPDSLAIAMRAVESQAADDLLHFEVLQDDETGIIMVYRSWYDRPYGKVYHTFELLFGAAKANTANLYRLTNS